MALKTTIRVSLKFRDWVEAHGKRGETMEDIVKRLCKYPGRRDEDNHTPR